MSEVKTEVASKVVSKVIITDKQLIELIAERSKYKKYEVNDVLSALHKVLSQELLKGNSVQLSGIGTFSLKEIQPRTFVSAIDGVEYVTQKSTSCSLKIDGYLRNALNSKGG
jgi:nucleoid DNA-binding protein